MDKYIGKRLDGRYEIRELIGVGGMANVYKAYDLSAQRVVAVKILREEYMDNEDFLRRFRNESRAISLLSHPNIVKVYDVSFTNKIQSIVMEYIDGITLKDYIDQEGTIRWKEAVHFTMQILQALQHAHDKGIVHRDIKPQNIMLLSDGMIKITDFGIARFSRSSTKTITDKAIGSVHYISPEQASGSPTDARTDIYSLGVLMFEMLTGKLPFEADSPVSVAIKQIQSQPIQPRSLNPDIPKGLEEIIMKAMQKDAAKRYQSAEEMLFDIENFKRDPSIVFEYKYVYEPIHQQKDADAVSQREERMNKPRKNKENDSSVYERKPLPVVPVMAGIAFAFLLAAGAFITMLFLVNKPFEQTESVLAPNLVGQTYETIRDQYAGSGAEVKIAVESRGSSSEYGEGVIFDQSPNSGKKVKKGSTVKVKVSTGKETSILPDYKGKDSTEVFRDLLSMNIKFVEQSSYSKEVGRGNVIKTAPSAGEEVAAGDTVTVFVSLGSEDTSVSVPLVENLNFHEAKSLVTTFRLRIECVEEVVPSADDTRAPGTIVKQDPAAASKVTPNSIIKVSVIAGDGWEDPNKKQKITIEFDLPEIEEGAHIQTELDGTIVKEGFPKVSQKTWKTEPQGKGEGKIVIYLDGNVYKTFDVNFDTGVFVETTGMDDSGTNLATIQGSNKKQNADDDVDNVDNSVDAPDEPTDDPEAPQYPDDEVDEPSPDEE